MFTHAVINFTFKLISLIVLDIATVLFIQVTR